MLLNVVYPIRPALGMDGGYRDAWGGPTLAGAWAVYALGGLGFWVCRIVAPHLCRAPLLVWAARDNRGRRVRLASSGHES